MSAFDFKGKRYNITKEMYLKYLRSYKFLNNGSLKGATSFPEFYVYKNYTNKYNDPRMFMTHVYH